MSKAVEQWEKLQQNSNNSSRPPSSDNPYHKGDSEDKASQESIEPETNSEGKEISAQEENSYNNEANEGSLAQNSPTLKKSPGHQPGTPSQWRSSPLVAEVIVPHYPNHCAACNQTLRRSDPKPYMGHYVLELEKGKSGFRVQSQLHHYYQGSCACGHSSQAQPGTGYVSEVPGRVKDLKLTEYVLVGPWLASLIASLGVRYRMSRANSRVRGLRFPQRGRSSKFENFSWIGLTRNWGWAQLTDVSEKREGKGGNIPLLTV